MYLHQESGDRWFLHSLQVTCFSRPVSVAQSDIEHAANLLKLPEKHENEVGRKDVFVADKFCG